MLTLMRCLHSWNRKKKDITYIYRYSCTFWMDQQTNNVLKTDRDAIKEEGNV